MRLGSRKKNRKMTAKIRNARPTAALKKAAVMTATAAAPPMKGQPEGSIRTNGTLHQVTRHKSQGTRYKAQLKHGGTKPQSQAFLCGSVSRCVVINAIEPSLAPET